MKTNPTVTDSGRTRIPRTVSLMLRHEQILAEAAKVRPELASNFSLLFQELLDNAVDLETGKAKSYLEARDRSIEFEEDVSALLTAAGFKVEKNAKVPGTPDGVANHRADFIVSHRGKSCIVELKSSARPDRLRLALGQVLILQSACKLPGCVCVPVIIDRSVIEAFDVNGIALVEVSALVQWVFSALGTSPGFWRRSQSKTKNIKPTRSKTAAIREAVSDKAKELRDR